MEKKSLEEQYFLIMRWALKMEGGVPGKAPKKKKTSKKKKETKEEVEVLSLDELNK